MSGEEIISQAKHDIIKIVMKLTTIPKNIRVGDFSGLFGLKSSPRAKDSSRKRSLEEFLGIYKMQRSNKEKEALLEKFFYECQDLDIIRFIEEDKWKSKALCSVLKHRKNPIGKKWLRQILEIVEKHVKSSPWERKVLTAVLFYQKELEREKKSQKRKGNSKEILLF